MAKRGSALPIAALLGALMLSACGGGGSGAGGGGTASAAKWTEVCGSQLSAVSNEDLDRLVAANVSVVLADVSQSTVDRREEFKEGLCATAQRLIDEGGQLWGGWITASGVQRFEDLGLFDFTPDEEGCANDLACSGVVSGERVELAEAVAVWIEDAVAATQEGAGTDVHSALTEAARTLHSITGAACRRIVIFSDMAERQLGDDVIGDDVNDVVDLAGIRVQVVGAGSPTQKITAEEAEQIKAYWDEFFARSGADYSPNDYGPTFLGLAPC